MTRGGGVKNQLLRGKDNYNHPGTIAHGIQQDADHVLSQSLQTYRHGGELWKGGS